MQSQPEIVKVLLIEDDEDDFILTRGLFGEIKGQRFHLEWKQTYDAGLDALRKNEHDICLVDYRLGAHTGIDLLRAAQESECAAPIILLTGQGEHEIDLEAMRAGAADYLVKGRLDGGLLERSIRYAIERKRAAALAAAEQARLAALGAEVGLALTQRDSLEAILTRCAVALVNYLNVPLARIWVYDHEEKNLQLKASTAGPEDLTLTLGHLERKELELRLLQAGKAALLNDLRSEPGYENWKWLKRERFVACAAYPLVLEERVVGLMTLYGCGPLPDSVLQELGSVSNGIALCIERKRSEQALGASQFKYQSVVENIKEVIFQVNEHGLWTFLNPAWSEMTGFKVNETLGAHFTDYIHPEDRERHRELFQQLIERKTSYCRDETRYLAKDGTFRWVEVYAQPTLDPNAFGASGTIRDITQRKRAEAEIQKLAAFVRLNPDPVMELAADGTLTYLNPAATEMARSLLPVGPSALAEPGVEEPEKILPKDAQAIACECLRLGVSKQNQEVTIGGRTLSWSFFPIIASQVVHCYGSDITERFTLEAQLRHAQKLESVGQLAAGVAHDFNNILTIIQGHADRLVEQCRGNLAITDPLLQISAGANRASSLTRQLLMFSRKQVMQTKVLDLNSVLSNLTKMLHRLLGDDIKLESHFAPTLPAIQGDMGMVEQVIMNLVVNARDAMPKGGKLSISTTTVEINETYPLQNPEARPGQFLCLTVSDTGCGMSKETLARIFEPFFTTKEVGKGTGLGLATVYGILKQHQGWVEVSSELGVGTTFKVYFPPTEKQREAGYDDDSKRDVSGGSETILLVEDEPVLRELAHLILNDYKYNVLEAPNGIEALKVWDEHAGKIDLLLTDLVMPEGMSGRELADELKRRKPTLKIIYTSGYSSEVAGSDLNLPGIKFLQKPYPPPRLAQIVRESLDH